MAELKRNFLKARMNKDLDERLVPAGEYRDALNVEIASSEGSEVGSVQTLKGNNEWLASSPYAKGENAATVGFYNDRENNHVYNFICDASTPTPTQINTDFGPRIVNIGYRSDLIEQITPHKTNKNLSTSKAVINDIYEVFIMPTTTNENSKNTIYNVKGDYFSLDNNSFNTAYSNVAKIRPGMRVQAIDLQGNDIYGAQNEVIVKSITANPVAPESGLQTFNIETTKVYNAEEGVATFLWTNNMKNQGVVLKFTAPRILKFKKGDFNEQETNVSGTPITNTPVNSYISAISAVNDYLFWTDGRNEPKKISISRSLAGNRNWASAGSYSNVYHTMLMVKKDNKIFPSCYLEESHITVIKPNPHTSLKLTEISSAASTLANIPVFGKPGGSNQPWGFFNFTDNAGNLFNLNANIYIQPQVDLAEPWEIGTVLDLTGFSTASKISVEVKEIFGLNPSANNGGYYVVNRVSDYPEGYDSASTNEPWTATIFSKQDLYSSDFVSFSYRYIYTDGETSCLAPFTTAAFLPGDYSYSPKDGYNLGMQNNIERIELTNFVHKHTPKDVSIIQLAFKSQKSDNVFIFREIDRVPNALTSTALNGEVDYYDQSVSHYDLDKVVVKEKLFGHTLPSDQLTRNFDAVPKKAIAQEIQANRLMYANYTQDYDLIDVYGKKIKPHIKRRVKSDNTGFGTSFNSNDTLFAQQGFHFSGVTNEDGDPIFVNNPKSYAMGHLASGYYTSQTIRMGVENDPGNNFEAGNSFSVYTAPATGYYKVKASAKLFGIYEDSTVFRPRNLRLAILPTYSIDSAQWQDEGVSIDIQIDPDNGLSQDWSFFTDSGPVGYLPDSDTANTISDNTYIYYNDFGLSFIPNQPGIFSPWQNLGSLEAAGATISTFEFGGQTNFSVSGGPSDIYISKIPETEIYLQEGQSIALYAQSDEGGSYGTEFVTTITEATFEVTEAPATTFDLPSLKGQKSIKSERNYNLGIIYRDDFGRESSVIVAEDDDFFCDKSKASNRNSLLLAVKNNAPTWAKTYKYFIKENTSKYNNLVLEAAFVPEGESLGGDYIYLIFNSIEKDKVKVGDYLVAKKQHNTSLPITDEEAKWRVVSLIGNIDTDGTVDGVTIPTTLQLDATELDGKFFVKVFREDIDGAGTVLGPLDENGALASAGSNNGAVFETEPDNNLDLDFYYEIGEALPIRLDKNRASMYIKEDSFINISKTTVGSTFESNVGIFDENHLSNPRVSKVEGAITKGAASSSNYDKDYYCKVYLNTPSNVDITCQDVGRKIKFKDTNDKYVEAFIGRDVSVGDMIIYVLPIVHYDQYDPLFVYNSAKLENAIGWYNCISFGNGVESDTIRDDFNGTELFKYISSGKQSGVKVSMPITNYSEYTKPNDIIFSELYNENRGLNRFNEFLAGKDIVKQISPDYGSIQKLFSRDNDLLTLCETKCLRVLSQKNALFNAKGEEQLLSTDNVLGQAIPFTGDYGISKNPESFAADEYRCYFTDIQRGVVIRLSMDGITPISKAGMDDWFSDHLVNTMAAIGSFDGDKEEYNLTIHEVNQTNLTKQVYTISFSEEIDGWTSFKSFIQEAGFTLNNKYYTFKNGDIYRHHDDTNGYNNFYGTNYESSITALFNDDVSSVKAFRYLDYEGTQARVIQNTNDKDYYNLNAKEGWYAEYLNTDLQESQPTYFLDKEGKWFSYVKGIETKHTNSIDGGQQEDSNIDVKEFSVQGLGNLTSNVTLISGTLPSQGFNLNINVNFIYESQADIVTNVEQLGIVSDGGPILSGGDGGY